MLHVPNKVNRASGETIYGSDKRRKVTFTPMRRFVIQA